VNSDAPVILFYDGDCGLCNRSVQFVLRFEKSNQMLFAPINSSFTRDFFSSKGIPLPDMSSMVVCADNQLFKQSTAVMVLLHYLKFPFPLLRVFVVLPVCWRDRIYNWVAKNRSRFGKSYCVRVSPEQQKRFM
jgi:predicted DCC family thiol-disulfide oxidoreductase YuxK